MDTNGYLKLKTFLALFSIVVLCLGGLLLFHLDNKDKIVEAREQTIRLEGKVNTTIGQIEVKLDNIQGDIREIKEGLKLK